MSPATIADAFHQAVQSHQSGRLPEAERLYRQILSSQPTHAGAMHLLGLIAGQMGHHAAGIDLIRQSLLLAPTNPDAWYNLGGVLRECGRHAEAIQAYQQAIALCPTYAAAYNNLGNVLEDAGQLDEAIATWQRAIAAAPSNAQAYNNLALGLRAKGDLDGAIAAWRQTIALEPACPEALNNLGAALTDRGELQEGISLLQRALAVRPAYANALSNLGIALGDMGKLDEAAECYRRAIAVDPDFAEAHLNLALDLLRRGQWREGWQQREWRWKVPGLESGRTFRQPRWNGEDLAGRTILLHHEQGLGDTLQFIRFVPLLARRGAKVILEVQAEVAKLAATVSGVTTVLQPRQPSPPFDFYCPLMSIPMGLGTTVDTVPANVPYLHADPQLTARWQNKIGGGPHRKIGLVWAGNPNHKNDRNRSIPFSLFLPLLDLKGIDFYSLQKGLAAGQAVGYRIIDWTAELTDFSQSAALIAQLDLIVCVDTAVAHLAGALGKPVWLLVPFVPDWRWLMEKETSDWYPTMRLFRQERMGKWESAIERVRAALTEH
ncbi:MAG TPA: tetratricopeptide repeat-containing glycosyltransferase family protein [Tepidisphaeraceae bacterium]|nr:tetratricopeptide repeat-containing glycosyltransferase family protein [Tepidisphaeraceae bacterium]